MLSPEAELISIADRIREPASASESTHISKREARDLMLKAIEAMEEIRAKGWTQPSSVLRQKLEDSIDLFKLDLQLGQPKPRTGI